MHPETGGEGGVRRSFAHRGTITGAAALGIAGVALWAQQTQTTPKLKGPEIRREAVATDRMYYRAHAIVPIVGTGKAGDPMRPMFAPPSPQTSTNRKGILGYTWEPSDDGKSALVEFVGANRAELSAIVDSKDPNVTVFDHGVASHDDQIKGFQQAKKGYQPGGASVRPH